MVEVGERDDQPGVVVVDEPRERGDVARVVDPRDERVLVGVIERRRERVGVGRDRRRACAPELGHDVDALARAGEEDGRHERRAYPVERGCSLVSAAARAMLSSQAVRARPSPKRTVEHTCHEPPPPGSEKG